MGRVGSGQGARALSQRETRSQGQGKTENLEGSHGLNAGRRENSPDAGEVTAGDAVRCEPRTSTSRSGSCAAGVGDPEPVSGALQGCKIVLRAGSGLWPVDRPRPRMPKPASVR